MSAEDHNWFDDYKIGVPLIDADHWCLFSEIGKINDLIEKQVEASALANSIQFLYEYVSAHFSREEQLMRDKGYPYYQQHKKLHHKLKSVVYAIRKIFLEAPEKIDRKKLKDFLEDWLKNHILKVDMELESYINGPYGEGVKSAGNLPPLQEKKVMENKLVQHVVTVPENKIHVIEACATILEQDLPEAADIEDIASSSIEISLDDALKLAEAVVLTD